MRIWMLMAVLAASLGAKQPLVVISVDGLDNRYLADADRLGLKIPNLRRLMAQGQVSRGVIGVFPTITWPSHTTILSGVDPVVHGILGNRRPKTEGGEYYWSVSLLRAPTLLDAAHQAGRKTAAITWPVTVDAPLDWNLPEYFHRRRGGSMDLASIESRSQPKDLVARITAEFPSFPQEWMDDRTRTQAVVYLLRHEHPDLLLVHLVDLDSEEHDNGPFSREAYAVLERTDELIGQMLAAMPKGSAAAVVSDHGFERVRTVVHLQTLAEQRGVTGVQAMGGIAVAWDAGAAAFLRGVAKEAQYGVGREIPLEEVKRFPSAVTAKAAAVFESAEGFQFSPQPGTEILGKPEEAGNHGHWPLRYRSVFVLWGPGIARETLPEFSIKEIAGRLAKVIGVPFTR